MFGSHHLGRRSLKPVRKAQLRLEPLEGRLVPTSPAVLSIARSVPLGQYTSATSVSYAVTFNETVKNVVAADFQVLTDNSLHASSNVNVSGSGASYTVTVDGIHGSGDLQLNLINNGSIVDGSGNALAMSFQGQTYRVDQAYPHVVSINRTTPASHSTAGGSVTFTVSFSEAVTGVSTSDFAVAVTGTAAATLGQASPVNGSVYTVAVNNIAGNGTVGLNLVDNGQIHDVAGNPLVTADGAALFAAPVVYQTGYGTNPVSVAVSGLKGNGIKDLVVANSGSPGGLGTTDFASIGLFAGNGDGTFQNQATFSNGNMGATLGAVEADVNGDGKPDLIVTSLGFQNPITNTNNPQLSVFLGNGDGTFVDSVDYANPSGLSGIVVADLTGNGQSDIVGVSASDSSVGVLLGNGNATFGKLAEYSLGTTPGAVAVADLAGNGIADLVVASPNGSVNVLLGNGDGTFKAPVSYAVSAGADVIAIANLTGNGTPDLIVGNSTDPSHAISVLLGNGDGTFKAPMVTPFTPGPAGPTSIAVADLTGNGTPDLVLATPGIVLPDSAEVVNGSIVVLLGNGDGTFGHQVSFDAEDSSMATPRFVTTADLNGDGRPDIVAVDPSDAKLVGSLRVLLNSGNGSFTGQVYNVGALTDRYVEQLYEDILQRPADSGALMSWSTAIDNGTLTRAQVAQAIAHSAEFDNDLVAANPTIPPNSQAPALSSSIQVPAAPVIQGYFEKYLHRAAVGDAGLVSALQAGVSIEGVQAAIFGSAEYYQDAGGTNAGFLQHLYQDALDRPIDSGSLTILEQAMGQGISAQAVAGSILQSAEYHVKLVGQYYLAYLRRSLDPAAANAWVAELQSGVSDLQVLAAILGSDEYFNLATNS
jgi:hypothetical protein